MSGEAPSLWLPLFTVQVRCPTLLKTETWILVASRLRVLQIKLGNVAVFCTEEGRNRGVLCTHPPPSSGTYDVKLSSRLGHAIFLRPHVAKKLKGILLPPTPALSTCRDAEWKANCATCRCFLQAQRTWIAIGTPTGPAWDSLKESSEPWSKLLT